MLARLKPHLQRDIVCDQTLASFYQGLHVILPVCSYIPIVIYPFVNLLIQMLTVYMDRFIILLITRTQSKTVMLL